jgi:hypothetical protein
MKSEKINCYDELNINKSDCDCSICTNKLHDDDQIIKLSCGHCFHTFCIIEWLYITKNCPLCRHHADSMIFCSNPTRIYNSNEIDDFIRVEHPTYNQEIPKYTYEVYEDDEEDDDDEDNEEGYQDIIERIRLERERKKREALNYKDLYNTDYEYVYGVSKKKIYKRLDNSNKKQMYDDNDINNFLIEV